MAIWLGSSRELGQKYLHTKDVNEQVYSGREVEHITWNTTAIISAIEIKCFSLTHVDFSCIHLRVHKHAQTTGREVLMQRSTAYLEQTTWAHPLIRKYVEGHAYPLSSRQQEHLARRGVEYTRAHKTVFLVFTSFYRYERTQDPCVSYGEENAQLHQFKWLQWRAKRQQIFVHTEEAQRNLVYPGLSALLQADTEWMLGACRDRHKVYKHELGWSWAPKLCDQVETLINDCLIIHPYDHQKNPGKSTRMTTSNSTHT